MYESSHAHTLRVSVYAPFQYMDRRGSQIHKAEIMLNYAVLFENIIKMLSLLTESDFTLYCCEQLGDFMKSVQMSNDKGHIHLYIRGHP